MLKSRMTENDLNRNRVHVKAGGGEYFVDILSLKVYDENGNEYNIGQLLDKSLKLEQENATLKNRLNSDELKMKNMANTFRDSINNLIEVNASQQKDIAELQADIKALKEGK